MRYISTGEAYLISLYVCAMICPWYDCADTELPDKETHSLVVSEPCPSALLTVNDGMDVRTEPLPIVCPAPAVDATCDG